MVKNFRERAGKVLRKGGRLFTSAPTGRKTRYVRTKSGAIAKVTSPPRFSRKTRRAVLGGAVALGVLQEQYAPGTTKRAKRGRAGRPKGTYKYYIPGKGPVPVQMYKRWATRQRALQRLQGPQPEVQLQQQPMQQPIQPPTYQEQVSSQQPLEQPSLPQQVSNNIMRPVGGNPLNAPNFLKGELTKANSDGSVIDVSRVAKPIANPRGEYYVEIEPASGKPILRRRISEKWLTN